jgi:deoxyribonuclease V
VQLGFEIPDLYKVLAGLLRQVPRGWVTTYVALADALGNRIATRWVGHYLLHHAHGPRCACHRVVRGSGEPGLYIAGTEAAKARRLAAEGVALTGGRIDLARRHFDAFHTDRPLAMLREVQESLAECVSLQRRRAPPETVAGLDVSYADETDAVGAYVLLDATTGRILWQTSVRRRVRFPYVSTYLSFRELPVLLDLVESARRAGKLAEVLLIDGSGVLHQRRAGVASHLGVLVDRPTIGVTKKLLCGEVDARGLAPRESRPVLFEGRTVGAAIRPTGGSARPIFVSPGHRVDVAFSEKVVGGLLLGRRLPEPLYWADRVSREIGRRGRQR